MKEKHKAISCRATSRVCKEDIELARMQIASKRLLLDDAISAIPGVYFFFSCISSVSSNSKTKIADVETASSGNGNEVYPCISYFIVYTPNENCDDNTFFGALHNRDVEPFIQPIGVRSKAGSSDMETAARQLFQTVKDHNNPTIKDMLHTSDIYCYENACDDDTDENDEEEDEDEFTPHLFPTLPCDCSQTGFPWRQLPAH